MSRDHTLFFASLVGGVLAPSLAGETPNGQQFVVSGPDFLVSPLALFLDRAEAAQWATVLTEYADGAA